MRTFVVSSVLLMTACVPTLAWADGLDDGEAAPATATSARGSGDGTNPWLVAGVVLMGSGVLAAIVGTTVGTVAAARYGALDCPDEKCGPAQFDDADAYNALRVPSGITIAAGGIMTAIGGAFVYAVLSAPTPYEPAEVALRLELSPSFVGLRGAF